MCYPGGERMADDWVSIGENGSARKVSDRLKIKP